MRALRRLAHRLRTRLDRRPLPALEGLDVYYNEVLAADREIERAVAALRWTHPYHRAKTWDLLKALHYVLSEVPERDQRILDAGCAHSPILERLHVYGYRSLFGCDLTEVDIPRVPGLVFRRGNLTRSPFPDAHFAVVTCLSVVEHGVPLDAFFGEMARLLSARGHLLVSTDYHDPKLSTADVDRRRTLGLPWTIHSRPEIEGLLAAAERAGFGLVQPIRWRTSDAPVRWAGKRYTFLFLALRKTATA